MMVVRTGTGTGPGPPQHSHQMSEDRKPWASYPQSPHHAAVFCAAVLKIEPAKQ